jgi:DNA polymerase III subunit alpha
MSKFIHLHSHSHFSLLEALPKTKEILAHVKKMDMDSVAITDNGTMYGVIEFYQKAKKEGVKPIIGVDFYMALESRFMKRARVDNRTFRLVCLAETNEGYQNLIKLSSLGFVDGFYYKPRIDKEILKENAKGLIGLSGGYMSEVDELLRMDRVEDAKAVIREYVEIFGEGNYFLELVDRPEIAEQEATNTKLIQLSKEMGVPLVATKNTNYLKPQDQEAWKVLNCIKGQKTLDHFNRLQQHDYDASMVTSEYMEAKYEDVPEAIENTRKIADRCNVEITLGEWNFPQFDIPEGETFRSVLTKRTYKELEEKEGKLTQEMIDRIEYEIDIIYKKGFCPYFLIVADFINWAKSQGIMTTTRGSAAGSIVSYGIGISGFNPLTYQLPFERFLNPQRPSAPDIDADFADNRRDEVLDYVRQKYGEEKVAQICTFGTMLARGSVRDVGRALGFEYAIVDEIAKLIPMGSQGFAMTLERALKEAPELKTKYDRDSNVHRIIDLAMQIEGCGRHVSIHAAGTVISPSAITDFSPIQVDTREGKVITQYEMHSVESAGLVKMDFLGIRNLSILGDSIHLVKKTKGVEIVLEELPVDDKKTFELLAEGRTMGVFQLSSDGMTKYLVELKPTRIEDIMAMVALYRPGPIEFIPEYIKRKHDPSKIDYPHEDLKSILEMSLGLLIYQDDVMLTAIKLAGYSWLEADKFRKAMGKKIPELMVEQKQKFKQGCINNNINKKLVDDLWHRIEPFATYAFNKAHAASYGMVAYQTAYMKANFPAEYMASLMTAESGDLEKIAFAVSECEDMGIEILPPDINESRKNFTYMNDKQIRFGLLVIKNLGAETIESIIEERKLNGEFEDLADFAGRVAHRAFNKKSLEALVKVGALDRFGERKKLMENIDRILMYNKNLQRERALNQQSLFSLDPSGSHKTISLRETPPATMRELLSWEKELIGLYVSGHPYEAVKAKLGNKLIDCNKVVDCKIDSFVRCGGVITSVKEIITKKGDPMAFISLQDTTGMVEIVVFPKTYAKTKEILVEDQVILVSAKASQREGYDMNLLANSFIVIDEDSLDFVVSSVLNGMWVEYGSENVNKTNETEDTRTSNTLSIKLQGKPTQEMIERLREIFGNSPGGTKVALLVESGGNMRHIETDYSVFASDGLIREIASMVGAQNVSVSS